MSVDDNNPQFGKYEVYVCIVGLIVTAVVQLWAMNQALRGNLYYLATSVYQSLLVVCPILVGATFYDELKGLDALHLAMFFAGQYDTKQSRPSPLSSVPCESPCRVCVHMCTPGRNGFRK